VGYASGTERSLLKTEYAISQKGPCLMPSSSVMNPSRLPPYPAPHMGVGRRGKPNRKPLDVVMRLAVLFIVVTVLFIGGLSLIYTTARVGWVWIQHAIIQPDPFSVFSAERPVRFKDIHGGLRVLDPKQILNWRQTHQASEQLDAVNDSLQADGWVLIVPHIKTYQLRKQHVENLFNRWNLGAHGLGGRGYVLVLSPRPSTVELWAGRGFCSALPSYSQLGCVAQGVAHLSNRLDGDMLKQVISHQGLSESIDHVTWCVRGFLWQHTKNCKTVNAIVKSII
jgi:hypothetical protein